MSRPEADLAANRRAHLAACSLLAATALLGACGALPFAADAQADVDSDAPESPPASGRTLPAPASYQEALLAWRRPEDMAGWIGAHFLYDEERAAALSESQRSRGPAPPILEPEVFYARPRGMCVDLARFAVETLARLTPQWRPRYLMIEFDPVQLRGQIVRRHWVAVYRDAEGLKVVADSKRPGAVAGPYRTLDEFAADYARYRGRRIVSYREAGSFKRRARNRATPLDGRA